jgi:hypothetical protein
MIPRILEQRIAGLLGQSKILHIPGPRQVGKTTLLKEFVKNRTDHFLWLNGDEADVRALFENSTSATIGKIIGNRHLVIIDEAQRIQNIGIALKIMVDNFPHVQVIATGSLSFDLANQINEPLTGRKTELFLFPLSFQEMVQGTSLTEEKRLIENRMIYGYYPEVVTSAGNEREILQRLTDAYLYKDLFAYERLKKASLIEKLLQALALQVGNQISFNEIGQTIGADNQTVERYIDLLEQAYVVYTLKSLSRNVRNELKKSRKVYFYDNGIRNAIIRNFGPLSLRQDAGALWENFIMSERLKATSYKRMWMNRYFWRTQAQQEIDYVEEMDGKFLAVEMKWNRTAKGRIPASFLSAYPDSETRIVTRDNFDDFLLL